MSYQFVTFATTLVPSASEQARGCVTTVQFV